MPTIFAQSKFKRRYFAKVYSRFSHDGKMASFTLQTRPLRRETSQQRQPEVILAVTSLPLAVPDVCRCRILSSLMFLRCNSNNRAETVLNLFLDAINRDGNLWPSRIRVDKGVENVLVCDAMVQARGEGRGSFIAGPSTHNQRIERLWKDVFRCVCHLYYYLFYAMESTGILNTDNQIHLFAIHLIFIPRINKALDESFKAFDHHKVRTEGNWSSYQMWTNGMFHADNPLSHGLLDEEPSEMEIYGNDPQGPSPTERDNHVVIDPVDLSHGDLLKSFVFEHLDPLRPN